ncbi:MAG: RlpA-like double-psi beta-barrel domain-containing protein [Actinomycetota bacterium]
MRTFLGTLIACCMLATPAQAQSVGAAGAAGVNGVGPTQTRVEQLAKRLDGLLLELQDATNAASAASGNLAIARLRISQAQEKADRTKVLLNAQARNTYMRGSFRNAQLLLYARDLRQVLTVGTYIGSSMRRDAEDWATYAAAIERIEQGQATIQTQRNLLQSNKQRLADLRPQLQQALESQRKILAEAQAEIAKLSELRRKELNRRGPVSAVVAARRTARQRELDIKLSALLSWLATNQERSLTSTGLVSSGLASWYGPGFDGRRASSGATYHQEQMTAASLVLPFGTILRVTYKGRSVLLVITDRGPYVAPRVLDLSHGASVAIGHSGVQNVTMEIMIPTSPAPGFP